MQRNVRAQRVERWGRAWLLVALMLAELPCLRLPEAHARPAGKAPGARPAARTIGKAGGAHPNRVQRARAVFRATLARFAQQRDEEAARNGFLEAAALDPSYAPPRYNLGVIAERTEQWEEAIRWYERFLQLDSTSDYAVRAQLKLDALRSRKQQEKTPEGRRRARFEAALTEAMQLLDAGRPGEAVARANDAARIDPSRWEAPVLAAAGSAQSGAFADAITLLRPALERAPEAQKPRLQPFLERCEREEEYLQLTAAADKSLGAGDNPGAAAGFEKAFQLFPNRSESGLAAAIAWVSAGDYGRAEALLQPLRQAPEAGIAIRAAQILGQIFALKSLSQAAAPGAQRTVPPSQGFSQEIATIEAELDAAERQSQAQLSAALQAAEQREQHLAQLVSQAEDAEAAARRAEEAANDFEQKAATSEADGTPGGKVAAVLLRTYATTRRNAANSARERAQQLREEIARQGGSN